MHNSCIFYIVRHAESEHNAGWKNGTLKVHTTGGKLGSDLTSFGVEQAKKRAYEFHDIHFDAVFSSDFTRAHRTAKIISLERKLEVLTSKLLRERSWGSLEGKSTKGINEEIKRLQKGLTDEQKMHFKLVPDAESDEEAALRMITFLREVAVVYAGKTVLVVSHGNIMRRFLTKIGFASYDELPALSIKNTGYFVLRSDGIDFEVVKTVGIDKVELQKNF